ncbi:hypothetical protein EDC96DRAFT_509922 [Choanephora cucurbitarum]|nr:hypothetical protein EDC96DRAFT_509922 [Choanephora cucurbitarum]
MLLIIGNRVCAFLVCLYRISPTRLSDTRVSHTFFSLSFFFFCQYGVFSYISLLSFLFFLRDRVIMKTLMLQQIQIVF